MRHNGITKNDDHAKELWGAAYDSIPKSVFATIAWHLANEASGSADTPGAAVARFMAELNALGAGNIIPQKQVAPACRALCK